MAFKFLQEGRARLCVETWDTEAPVTVLCCCEHDCCLDDNETTMLVVFSMVLMFLRMVVTCVMVLMMPIIIQYDFPCQHCEPVVLRSDECHW